MGKGNLAVRYHNQLGDVIATKHNHAAVKSAANSMMIDSKSKSQTGAAIAGKNSHRRGRIA